MNIASIYHGALSGFVFTIFFAFLFIYSSAQPIIKFRYMAPTEDIEKNFKNWIEDKDAHHKGLSTAKINEWNEDVFRKVAPEELVLAYDGLTETDAQKNVLPDYFNISGGKVFVATIYLVNDFDGLEMDKFSAFHLMPSVYSGGEPYLFSILPRAYNIPFEDGSGEYAATIYLGVHYLEFHDKAKEESDRQIALRLLAYTQFVEKDQEDEWGSLRRFAVYTEDDNLSYREELWDDPDRALISGFASFFCTKGDDFSINAANEKFYSNAQARYLITQTSPLAEIPGMDVDEQRTETKIREFHQPLYAYYFKYLPPEAFLHSETLSYLFFSEWYQNIPEYITSQSYRTINNGKKWINELTKEWWNDHTNRNLHYAVMTLAQKMEVYSRTRRGQNQIKSKQWISSMYPFALFDYLTRFSFSEDYLEKVYDQYYTDDGPQAFRMYMDFYRKEVKELTMTYYNRLDKDGEFPFAEGLEALISYFKQTHTIIK